MKVPRNVEYTSKINNCIDELLMQDTTFNQQLRKNKQFSKQNGQVINRRQLNKNVLSVDSHQLPYLKQSQVIIKRYEQKQKKVNFPSRRRRQNRQHVVNAKNNNKKEQQQNRQKQQQQQTKSIIVKKLNNNKDNNVLRSTKAEQKYHTINILNKQQVNKVRLKKTYSYQVKDNADINNQRNDVINQRNDVSLFDDHVMEQLRGSDDDLHSPTYLLGTISNNRDNDNNHNSGIDSNHNSDIDSNSNWLATSINNNQNNSNNNYPSIRDKLRNRVNPKYTIFNNNNNNNKNKNYQHQYHYQYQQASLLTNNDNHLPYQYQSLNKHSQQLSQQQSLQQQQTKRQQQFHLTHQQLQFLSLLYPNESPQQLMLKLLSYYQQQQLYNNSFQQLFQSNQQVKTKNQQFFRTKHEIQYFNTKRQINNTNGQKDQIIESEQQQSLMYDKKGISLGYSLSNYNYGNNNNNPTHNKISTLINNNNFSNNNNNNSNTNKYTPTKSNYSKLKQECLASIGQQMVQTQIKSSLAQTVNVNYYTRQYAMPIIMETINQKNQQAQNKLNKLQQIILAHKEKQAQKIQEEIIMTLNQQKIAAVLAENYQTINTQSTNIPSQFTHKVYIPANSRGQSFEMDYKPDSKLFEYISQNEYHRILRDINHLIQKVLSYHRHSSFLKRKNNSLLKGWNLTLLLFLFLIIVMLCVRSFFIIESQYLQIIVFFCLSFIVILILGNSFNNYKRNVKRSSVIKDICQQLSNYLDFINSSNKNIKWVLGKDFFWLQIWIDVIKNKHHVQK